MDFENINIVDLVEQAVETVDYKNPIRRHSGSRALRSSSLHHELPLVVLGRLMLPCRISTSKLRQSQGK
jgi:hypothetical protein